MRVLPARLAVVRLPPSMLSPSAHALTRRLLFTPTSGAHCFWSYTHIGEEISIMVDEVRALEQLSKRSCSKSPNLSLLV